MWPGKRIFCDSIVLRLPGPYFHAVRRCAPRGGPALRAPLLRLSAALALSLSLVPAVAHATTFPLAPGQTRVGEAGFYVTNSEDTLLDIARANDLGYGQLMAVNRDVDPWLPGPGRKIVLPGSYLLPPGPRKGIVIDLAVQGALISHQHIIYALRPDARARLNTLFMGGMFLGGAGGSALAITAWQMMAWQAVCLLGSALAAVAFLLHMVASRRSPAGARLSR